MFATIFALVKKELIQVRRDSNMVRMLFVMPIVQMFLLAYAVNSDVKLIYTAVYDFDKSDLSREYIRSFSPGEYFVTGSSKYSLLECEEGFKNNSYNVALTIPQDFSNNLENSQPTEVGFMVDGTNSNSAAIAMGYAGVITQQFNSGLSANSAPIKLAEKRLYNPEAESVYFTVPGIIATLITMITIMQTSMAIVKEREIGTLEQLMVTPITTSQLILGKIIPFALIGYIEMTLGLVLGILIFKIPFVGSVALLYGLTFVFLFATLGLGMFISSISSTQQQAMFFAWFFSVFSMLMSGFFTPIANMPQTIQYLTYLNPLRYFLTIVRGIMMKGATLSTLYPEVIAMAIFGVAIFTLSWLRTSKRVK